MVVIKKKKSKKQRGQRTHGWGAGKKQRGKGHSGGHGASNVGKRGGSKKTKYLAAGKTPYGKKGERKGLTKKFKVFKKTINIFDIVANLTSWTDKGLVSEKNKIFEIDLEKLGYDKLLSRGSINVKLNIRVPEFSEKAKQKVEEAGGKILSEKASKENSEE